MQARRDPEASIGLRSPGYTEPPTGAPPARLVEVAVHEAGHAVCAHLLGRANYGAAIFDEGGRGAGLAGPGDLSTPPAPENYTPTALDGAWDKDAGRAIIDHATIVAAGWVAVAIHKGHPFNIHAGGWDRNMLNEMAYALFDEADYYMIEGLEHLAKVRARFVLSPEWHCVKKVADVLIAKRTLTADEVAGIMREARQSMPLAGPSSVSGQGSPLR